MDLEESGQVPLVCGTLLLGGVLVVLGLYLASKRRRQLAANQDTGTTSKNVADPDKKSEQREVSAPMSGGGGSSKRQAKSKKRREAQQEFTHPWIVGTLKGHTGPVLDMDFSANGKYLASSAEDCGRQTDIGVIYRQKIGYSQTNARILASAARKLSPIHLAAARKMSAASITSTPSSPGKSSSSTDSSSSLQEEQRAGKALSRRQRKNRREQRKDDTKKDQEASVKPAKMVSPISTESQDSVTKMSEPIKNRKPQRAYKLNKEPIGLRTLTDMQFMRLLRKHCLSEEQLRCQGFPMRYGNYVTYFNTRKSRYQGTAEWDMVLQNFYANPKPFFKTEKIEFISTERNSTDEEDSGHGSLPSSVESSDVDVDVDASSDSSDVDDGFQQFKPKYLPAHKRECTRCSKHYYVNAETGDYLFSEKCYYHWGKLSRNNWEYNSHTRTGELRNHWECCRGRENTRGCTPAKAHVWSGSVPGYNGPFLDFAETKRPTFCAPYTNYGVFAVDCEMVFTKKGMELAKVSVVDLCGEVVYDTLIKPEAPVICYNTRFSGLRAKDLDQATKTLKDVQNDLLSFVNSHTILIGHSLESDLRALKIVHKNVVDTSLSFPHALGPPLRRSLKEVARTELNKNIQIGEHDSMEDARTVVDLILHKMQKDIEWLGRESI